MRPCTACWRFRCHAACFLAWAGSSGFGFCCPGDTEYYGRIAAAQAHYHGAQQYVGSGKWSDDIQYHHALCGNQSRYQFFTGMVAGTVPDWQHHAVHLWQYNCQWYAHALAGGQRRHHHSSLYGWQRRCLQCHIARINRCNRPHCHCRGRQCGLRRR